MTIMNVRTVVFERKTNNGHLVCSVVTDNETVTDYQAVTVLMEIDGKQIEPVGSCGVNMIDDRCFTTNRTESSSAVLDKLLKNNAVGCWGMGVALFGNEPELIQKAVDKAWIDRIAWQDKIIKEADITIIERSYNGAPRLAENEHFRWFSGQPDDLQILTEQDSDSATIFRNAIYILSNRAEKAYEKRQIEKASGDYAEWRSKFTGLSDAQLAEKAQEYDNLANEGGEGFNPYRF